eukprot:757725-Hanusia_phi.AAC.3
MERLGQHRRHQPGRCRMAAVGGDSTRVHLMPAGPGELILRVRGESESSQRGQLRREGVPAQRGEGVRILAQERKSDAESTTDLLDVQQRHASRRVARLLVRRSFQLFEAELEFRCFIATRNLGHQLKLALVLDSQLSSQIPVRQEGSRGKREPADRSSLPSLSENLEQVVTAQAGQNKITWLTYEVKVSFLVT